MKLSGVCRCGAVSFEVESRTPYPYMRCYCSICRKTGGSGGYAVNLMGDAGSLEVIGCGDEVGLQRCHRWKDQSCGTSFLQGLRISPVALGSALA